MEVKGFGGSVEFDGDQVILHHGALSRTHGVKDATIPVTSITDVKVIDATMMKNGSIGFGVLLPDNSEHEAAKNVYIAANDYYALVFSRKHQDEIKQLVGDVDAKISDYPTPLPREYEVKLSESYKSAEKVQEVIANRGFDSRIATFKGEDGTKFSLHKFTISKGFEEKELDGVTARVESGSDLQSRITVTRLLVLHVFALALKKKKGGEKYVTIEGPDFVWVAEAGRKQIRDAYTFVASVNNAAKNYLPPEPNDVPAVEAATSQPEKVGEPTPALNTEQLVQLSQLHDQEVLTDEEFAAAKKKALGI